MCKFRQFRVCTPVINNFSGQIPAFNQRLRFARDEQRGGSVEQDGVEFRSAFLATQNAPHDFRVGFAVAADQIRQLRRLHRELFR